MTEATETAAEFALTEAQAIASGVTGEQAAEFRDGDGANYVTAWMEYLLEEDETEPDFDEEGNLLFEGKVIAPDGEILEGADDQDDAREQEKQRIRSMLQEVVDNVEVYAETTALPGWHAIYRTLVNVQENARIALRSCKPADLGRLQAESTIADKVLEPIRTVVDNLNRFSQQGDLFAQVGTARGAFDEESGVVTVEYEGPPCEEVQRELDESAEDEGATGVGARP